LDLDFKVDPIWKSKEVLGIDVGTKSIKVVQLKKKGKLTKLVGYGKIEVPENFIIEGIIAEPEKLAELLKDLFKTKVWGKITAIRVNASLPESKIFTRAISLPHMSEKERGDAIVWEASQSIPMALSDLNLDWQVVGPSITDPKSDEIIYAAAPKSIVNSYLQLFELLGLEIFGMETSLTAIARAMIPLNTKNETILVIDLGSETTNMAVVDQILRVTGSTPYGGEHITDRIATALGVTKGEAEKIKVSKAVENQKKIREAIDLELTEITKEADRIVRYYNEKISKDNAITKILVSGGGANLPGVTEILTEKLGIPAAIGNPWANISVYPIKPLPKNEAVAYTNAVGLSLVGVMDE
jgi:type IV pilus assembly protein PilM